jgi:hypothetical protein
VKLRGMVRTCGGEGWVSGVYRWASLSRLADKWFRPHI